MKAVGHCASGIMIRECFGFYLPTCNLEELATIFGRSQATSSRIMMRIR
jgi:hypothetical protein